MKVNKNYQVRLDLTTKLVQRYEMKVSKFGEVTELSVVLKLPYPMKIEFRDEVLVDCFRKKASIDNMLVFEISDKECEDLKEYCLSNTCFKYGDRWYLNGAIYD